MDQLVLNHECSSTKDGILGPKAPMVSIAIGTKQCTCPNKNKPFSPREQMQLYQLVLVADTMVTYLVDATDNILFGDSFEDNCNEMKIFGSDSYVCTKRRRILILV